ncbi:DUF5343 domain-containing protein [Janthinobacterium sp. SUN033]|uniref:DUF5343 domain-containing protein n=1 Tax=Janthinobacterium sp. SUN033 TaxID=3002439 RepID=UPI0025B10680|nr:DUF5343 domain-containing protein [Janthinobacterium sp. SUN033]MDN2679343.1 DUF5343 domain-containing protein [Janthinobacterium sp. SUN033]
MASKTERLATPPIVSFSSFVSFLNQLREHGHVPTRIDKTLMPTASGSQTSGMLAALKYLSLIDDVNRPSETFQSLVMEDDSKRKETIEQVLRSSYSFLFSDSNFNLEKATSGEMTEKFRELNISGSTLTKTISFFLAAAKESGIKVSSHIRPPTTVRLAKGAKKTSKLREDEPAAPKTDQEDPTGTERFEIPIPGKTSVKVIVPGDLDADDWEMLQSMITVYIKRWKGFKSPNETN